MVSPMISTIGEKSMAPVLGMIRRTGVRIGSSKAFTDRQIAATKSLCALITLNCSSSDMMNCTITRVTTIETR